MDISLEIPSSASVATVRRDREGVLDDGVWLTVEPPKGRAVSLLFTPEEARAVAAALIQVAAG